MNPHLRSRRGFICGLFAGLTAWLCPRPSLRADQTTALPPTKGDRCVSYRYACRGQRCTTYEYDGRGRLVRVTEQPLATRTPFITIRAADKHVQIP